MAIMELMPRPEARASGRLAKSPIAIVMMPAPKQVLVIVAAKGTPAPCSIWGFSAMI